MAAAAAASAGDSKAAAGSPSILAAAAAAGRSAGPAAAGAFAAAGGGEGFGARLFSRVLPACPPPVMNDPVLLSPEDAPQGSAVPTDPYTSLKQNYDGLVQFLTTVSMSFAEFPGKTNEYGV